MNQTRNSKPGDKPRANGETMSQDPLDIAKVRQLARIMKESDLSEIVLQADQTRVRLRRGFPNQSMPQMMTTMPQQFPVAAPAPVASASTEDGGAAKKPDSNGGAPAAGGTEIKSPIVGTFYSAPSPDAKPFVTVGKKVTPETIVCIVEAMKVYNEIPAGVSGTVTAILVENGSAVEYNTPLFRVQP